MNTPTILVTGATGNVGRPLVAGLLADGARVRALTRDLAAAGFAAAASLLSLATARTRRRISTASPGNQAPAARVPVADAA